MYCVGEACKKKVDIVYSILFEASKNKKKLEDAFLGLVVMFRAFVTSFAVALVLEVRVFDQVRFRALFTAFYLSTNFTFVRVVAFGVVENAITKPAHRLGILFGGARKAISVAAAIRTPHWTSSSMQIRSVLQERCGTVRAKSEGFVIE